MCITKDNDFIHWCISKYLHGVDGYRVGSTVNAFMEYILVCNNIPGNNIH